MKSSFIPDMEARSDNETYYSSAGTVLNGMPKLSYVSAARNYTDVTPTQYFMPRNTKGAIYLNTGYVSEAVAGEDGRFSVNPSLEIILEAAYKCFGLTVEFGRNHPAEMVFHAFHNGALAESYVVAGLEAVTVVSHEFPEFDRLLMEFTKGVPINHIDVNNITFGDSTDYILEYGNELTKTPKGTQQTKVKELQVIRTMYSFGGEVKELARQQVSGQGERITFHFSFPVYDLFCNIGVIVAQSSYFAIVEVPSRSMEIIVSGREYFVSQAKLSRPLNVTGTLEVWENPLVSSFSHADDLAGWVGDYLRADREYDLQYRGEPRIDANDIMFLENKYVPDLLLRAYQHTLKFNGSLSGTIKARRDVGNVAAAKNRLARRG